MVPIVQKRKKNIQIGLVNHLKNNSTLQCIFHKNKPFSFMLLADYYKTCAFKMITQFTLTKKKKL